MFKKVLIGMFLVIGITFAVSFDSYGGKIKKSAQVEQEDVSYLVTMDIEFIQFEVNFERKYHPYVYARAPRTNTKFRSQPYRYPLKLC